MKKIMALLLVALLLTGCGSQGGAYVPTGDALFQDTTAPDSDTPVNTNQELTLGYNPDGTLNPYTETDATNRLLFSLMYQGLFSVSRSYEVEPVLCKSYTVSKDMKNYVFYLEDATFSDGSAVTAEDVAQSLRTAWDSPVYAGRFTYVSAITAADGVVIVALSTPCENLPILLDIPIVKAAETQEKWPMGTGAYYPETALSGLRLVRRSNWWCRADLAVTTTVVPLLEVESATTIRDDFEYGDIGLVCADPGTDTYVDYRCDYELWDCETGVFLYLACNEKSTVFSDETLRAALTYAIDRETLVTKFYGGFASPASLPASPRSPYYSEKLASQYSYDAEKFQQLVTEAAPKDMNITLLVNSADSRRTRVAKEIAKMLEKAGFVVTVSALSGTAYTNALNKANYDLHLGQTKLSPNMDLSAFFAPKGSLNFGGMSDAALYVLCQEALANAGNYYTLHQKVMASGMLCPILFRSYAIYGQRGVFDSLTPARDNVFWYTLGRTLQDAETDT